jgi:hypothetical protein
MCPHLTLLSHQIGLGVLVLGTTRHELTSCGFGSDTRLLGLVCVHLYTKTSKNDP